MCLGTEAPIITVQPGGAVLPVGQAVSLNAVHTGTGPFGYQWLKDGAILPGRTNSSFAIGAFQFADSGSYCLVVSNGAGMAISIPASLSVPHAPLRGWGYNALGQLGNQTWTSESQPTVVASGVVNAAAGGAHSLWVKADGVLHATGANSNGQLGNGALLATNRPSLVASNVVAVAAGSDHSLFIKSSGALWAMGRNADGQLGLGSSGNATNRPAFVTTGVVAVAAGHSHSLFIRADATLWAMGHNLNGQLGNGDTNDMSLPVLIASNVVAAAAGSNHSLFLQSDGTLWGMGWNSSGQLGNGSYTGAKLPILIADHVLAMAAGDYHTLFIKDDATLWSSGLNHFGQLGLGMAIKTNLPTLVASNVAAVAGGRYHSLFALANGAPRAMGYNIFGQLGNGTTNNANIPTPVGDSGLQSASLAHGPLGYHSLAIAGAPPVLQALSNRTVAAGQPAEFSVNTAGGDGPFTFQWQRNGTNLVGATNATWTLASAAPGDAGIYSVTIVGPCGLITGEAVLDVQSAAMLSIESAHGIVSPTPGSYSHAAGVVLTNTAGSPDTQGTTQFVCTGWTLTDHEPHAGTTSVAVVTLTNNALLTWQWCTNYRLTAAAGPHGTISTGDSWQAAGAVLQISAMPAPYYHFVGWTGDAVTQSNPFVLSMDRPLSVVATFAANMSTNRPTPEWWLAQHSIAGDIEAASMADTDADGHRNWQEYIAGTNPTNAASLFRLSGASRPVTGGHVLEWDSVSGRTYRVLGATSLLEDAWTANSPALPSTGGRMAFTNGPTPADALHIRLSVELSTDSE